jgi:hypothetical protein
MTAEIHTPVKDAHDLDSGRRYSIEEDVGADRVPVIACLDVVARAARLGSSATNQIPRHSSEI